MNDLSDHPGHQDIKTALFTDLLKLQKEMNDGLVLTPLMHLALDY